MQQRQYLLTQNDIPREWYNVAADLGEPPPPPLHPATQQPCGPEDLAPIFPMALLAQEMSGDRWVKIPEEILDILSLWRPTPLFRATKLEAALDTPAKIFYKYEGSSPAGSHKLNTAVAQAFYNKMEGTKRIATETGAGQWGSALAMACKFMGIGCTVYMVRCSYDQKPFRRSLMHVWGADVHPSPSATTPLSARGCRTLPAVVDPGFEWPISAPAATVTRPAPRTR